jgi:hypothetical protein
MTSKLGRACNSVQCATGTLAFAATAIWNLQLTDSKESCRVRIPPSPTASVSGTVGRQARDGRSEKCSTSGGGRVRTAMGERRRQRCGLSSLLLRRPVTQTAGLARIDSARATTVSVPCMRVPTEIDPLCARLGLSKTIVRYGQTSCDSRKQWVAHYLRSSAQIGAGIG